MIFRPLTVICLVAFLGAGLYVYQTKHAAMEQDRELRGIARKVEEAEVRTQALQAEWASLNQQERLRGFVQRHLPGLEPMQPSQFARASEAERRLPAVVAYAGPTALFTAREPAMPADATTLALLPRVAEPVQVAVMTPPAAARPVPSPLVPAPLAAAPLAAAPLAPVALPPVAQASVSQAPVPQLPVAAAPLTSAPAVAGPALAAPTIRLALPVATPRAAETVVAARHAERAAETPRPMQAPLPIDLARLAPPRPALRPAPRPETVSLPPIAAPVAPRSSITQIAAATVPRAAAAPQSYPTPSFAQPAYPQQAAAHQGSGWPTAGAQNSGAQALSNGSALGAGGGRPMLPPPVPFGSAGAATLGSGGFGR